MAIAESLSRLVAAFVATLQTRAQLAAVEVEEEVLRYFSYLLLALAAMFCAVIAIMLGILLIVAVYWDTHRIGVLVTLIAIFVGSGAFIAWKIRDSFRHKPHLLENTLTELSRDIETLNLSHQGQS